jgi:hypothetical protein
MDGPDGNAIELEHRTKRLAYLDIPGAGQVYVAGDYAYVGHLPNKDHLGTSIIDVKDPRNPKIVSTVTLDDHGSHSHKARVIGDVMIVNHERNMTAMGRRAEELPAARARLDERLGRAPTHADLAAELGVEVADIAGLEKAEAEKYRNGGFKVYDVSDRTRPKEIAYHRTGGIGVHRFDMDERYAYISTEMEGYVGNILAIYDIADPARPQEVSRWWMPGQHLAGGERPDWKGRRNRLHHAMRVGDRLWAGCWHAGVRIIDVSDIAKPTTIGAYNYHPPFPEPSHTFFGVPFKLGGRDIALAIDEEDQYYSAADAAARRGRPHAPLWVFDVTDPAKMQPLAIFQVSETESPWSRTPGTRFGAHQFQEHMKDTLVYCAWFSGGLRIVDIADPAAPREIGWYVPQPVAGRRAPQTNDVDVDERGLVYLVDRFGGFDIVEFDRPG